MSPQDQNAALSKLHGKDDLWVILKRGLYYRPRAAGYTSKIEEAGIYTYQEAKRHEYVYPGIEDPVTIDKLPPLDYVNDLNAIHEIETLMLTDEQRRLVWLKLLSFFDGGDEEPTFATAAQRAEAILKVLRLWVS